MRGRERAPQATTDARVRALPPHPALSREGRGYFLPLARFAHRAGIPHPSYLPPFSPASERNVARIACSVAASTVTALRANRK